MEGKENLKKCKEKWEKEARKEKKIIGCLCDLDGQTEGEKGRRERKKEEGGN